MESIDAEFSDHGRTSAWAIAKAEPLTRLMEKGVTFPDHVIESLSAAKLNEIDSLIELRKKAKVILFKASGKYYTEEEWEIPTQEEVIERGGNPGDSVVPYCMQFSKDFRRIGGDGAVLIETQEPWGYPHLIPGLHG